jgi:hypothetical protein
MVHCQAVRLWQEIVETALETAQGYNLVSSIEELPDVDVALLCIPTRAVPEVAPKILALGINTVDSYDIHGRSWQICASNWMKLPAATMQWQ